MDTSSPHLSFDSINLDELRSRLRKMSDLELIAFGKAARYMCSPKANLERPPRLVFVIQSREAREEWKRRGKECQREDLYQALAFVLS